jgi:hypothetical protein
MISDLEFSSKPIGLNEFSTPGDEPGDHQKDNLDDVFLLLRLYVWKIFK